MNRPLRRSRLGPTRSFWLSATVLVGIGLLSVVPLLLVTAPPAWAAASVHQVITNLRNWLIGILAGLATLFLTVGGVRYLLAGGDAGEVEKAKGALKAAAIGYGLAILAPVLVTALKSIVGTR